MFVPNLPRSWQAAGVVNDIIIVMGGLAACGAAGTVIFDPLEKLRWTNSVVYLPEA